MKFEIHIRIGAAEARVKTQDVKGFTSLADACAAAIGIAQQHEAGTQSMISVWLPKAGRHNMELLNCTRGGQFWKPAEFSFGADNALRQALARRKAAKARHDFLKNHPMGQGEAHRQIFGHEAVRLAFLRNDFATVKQFLNEKNESAGQTA